MNQNFSGVTIEHASLHCSRSSHISVNSLLYRLVRLSATTSNRQSQHLLMGYVVDMLSKPLGQGD